MYCTDLTYINNDCWIYRPSFRACENGRRRKLKKILGALTVILIFCSIFSILTPQIKAENSEEDHGTVYDYKIVSATQTGKDEITVKLEVRYCPYCNPNVFSMPGCPEFTHGYPPPYYPYHYWCGGFADGRYVAVRIKDSTGVILGTQKLVCNPINWPLNTLLTRDFVFSGVSLVVGSTIIAEADVYCSWCGHWYPAPVTLEIAPLKVCIDPGHGGIDPGTLGWDDMISNSEKCPYCGEICKWEYDDSASFPNEEDINLDVALKLNVLLEAKNIEVIMTRTTDTYVTLQQRCDIANDKDCDIFVSIHCNAQKCPCCEKCQNPYHTAHGAETHYYPGSINGLDLAKYIQLKLTKSTGLYNRGTKGTAFYVLKNTKMPAALTEVAFLTNQNDFKYIKTNTDTAAQGIANGIFKYFEERGLKITAKSPVDVIVTDPDGLLISKQVNEIPGATYTEIDLDGDGDLDDQVRIPDRKIGDYIITVISEPDALPTDTYTLEVSIFGTPILIAENVPISEIPAQPYKIISTETGIIPPVITAMIDFDPDILNLKSKGSVVTVYIELLAGYNVNQIDVPSIKLNNTVLVLTKPTEIGDYDGDGIADLMVKFDRAKVIELFNDKTIPNYYVMEVTGTVLGNSFKGTDTIKAISPP